MGPPQSTQIKSGRPNFVHPAHSLGPLEERRLGILQIRVKSISVTQNVGKRPLGQILRQTSVRRGEATVPWPPPQTLKIKKCKTTLSKTCFQNAQRCVFLGVILQNFPGGMPPDPPRMVVSSALPLKLICDVTRLWWNLAPSRKFSAYATAQAALVWVYANTEWTAL